MVSNIKKMSPLTKILIRKTVAPILKASMKKTVVPAVKTSIKKKAASQIKAAVKEQTASQVKSAIKEKAASQVRTAIQEKLPSPVMVPARESAALPAKVSGKKKTSPLVKVSVAAAAVMTAVAGGSSVFLASYITGGKRQTLTEALQWQGEHYDISWFDVIETNPYTIRSYDGYELHVEFCRCPQETTRYVILTHGYTDNRFGSLKYMKMYLDRGYHCIIYDLRGHGANQKTWCSYSIREAKDLSVLIADTRTRYPDLTVLGLHGESLGASTTAAVLKYHPRVDFAVADCGFADILNVLKGALAHNKMQSYMVYPASLAAKLLYGYGFTEMRPIDSLKKGTCSGKVPILFLHGQEDTFILPSNSQRMHDVYPGESEVRLIPGASHANSVLTDPVLYRTYLYEFLGKYGF